ncbi:MAG: PaaI family thioesterase [Pseudomonadales bacterium]
MGLWQDLLDGYVEGTEPEPLVNQKLGLGTLDEWRPGFVSKRWAVDEDLFHGRALFGGYIAALADQMLGLAAMTVLEDGVFFGTTNMSINYLAPVTGGDLVVEARVIAHHRKAMLVECSFLVEDALVAKATAIEVIYANRDN